MSYFEDVYRWNHKAGHLVRRKAAFARTESGMQRQELAMNLVQEEFVELMRAYVDEDPVELADACADLVWVVCGLAGACGIDLDAAWSEVKRTNYAKLGGPLRDDGKLLKPEGWQPPDMSKAIDGRDLATIVGL